MFSFSSLKTRFLPAWFLLIATAIAGGIWSSAVFYSMAVSIDLAVREAQDAIETATSLAEALEREDDALLLFLADQREMAKQERARRRAQGNESLRHILRLADRVASAPSAMRPPPNTAAEEAAALQDAVDAYRRSGDELLRIAATLPNGSSDGLDRYHRQVNPLLRRAVARCDEVRERNFGAIRMSAMQARDAAVHGGYRVLAISACSLLLGAAIAVWQTRSVLQPIGRLTNSVDAIRRGDFDARIESPGTDELGRMSEGFNQMAASLSEYRRSSLGELLESKSILRSTIDALPDPVWLFDPHGVLADCNPPGARMMDSIGGLTPAGCIDRALPGPLADAVESARRGQETRPVKLNFSQTISVLLDGRPRRVMFTAVPVQDWVASANSSNRRFGAVVVFDDVTEFAKLDELRSDLIGVASHELKSPLTTLQMNLLMLSETGDSFDQRQRELLSAANAGSLELAATIDELLDVTRVEADQLHLNVDPCDLRVIATSVAGELQGRFTDAGLVLEQHLDTAAERLRGDSKRLARVLVNLLENALKYSPKGGRVLIEVKTAELSTGEHVARLSVTDQGPGIPPEYRERIFDKFFRVENSGEFSGRVQGSTPRGTGIGLYLCREIIRAHRGQIACEPGPQGTGTRIVITIPTAA